MDANKLWEHGWLNKLKFTKKENEEMMKVNTLRANANGTEEENREA